jgi:branched-chain amino acid transport system ATP-binding protein
VTIVDPSGAHADPDVAAALSDVTIRFGGVVALDSVSMEIHHGEVVGLIGPNGAGKTTLMNVLAGVLKPTSGEIRCFGNRTNGNSPVTQARLGIARTFQQLSLLREMTVREHVMFGYLSFLRSTHRFGGYWISKPRLNALAAADTSPLSPNVLLERFGLDSVADQLAAEQSVGIARMVDLSRALAMRPKLLLLDEPVSGLAEPEIHAVVQSLQDIRNQHRMAVLVVEHNMEFARKVSERMVALDFGVVIGEGPCDEVLSSDRLRKAYFGLVEAEVAEERANDGVASA